MYDGLWTVEFASTMRLGTGVIVLNNGRLLGGDAGYYYSGRYRVNGNNVQGNIDVIRYDTRSISVFGDLDQFSLSFSGEISDYQFSLLASVVNKPEYKININGNKKEDMQP